VSDDDLTPDNFASVECMTSFVIAKAGEVRVAAE
jgi:hypothetical protein